MTLCVDEERRRRTAPHESTRGSARLSRIQRLLPPPPSRPVAVSPVDSGSAARELWSFVERAGHLEEIRTLRSAILVLGTRSASCGRVARYLIADETSSTSVLLVAGGLTAGAFVAVASYLGHVNGTLPRWLSVSGYVVAVAQLAASVFLPFLLFFLWVFAVSIVLLRRRGVVIDATEGAIGQPRRSSSEYAGAFAAPDHRDS